MQTPPSSLQRITKIVNPVLLSDDEWKSRSFANRFQGYGRNLAMNFTPGLVAVDDAIQIAILSINATHDLVGTLEEVLQCG